jgi:hypothetical protein
MEPMTPTVHLAAHANYLGPACKDRRPIVILSSPHLDIPATPIYRPNHTLTNKTIYTNSLDMKITVLPFLALAIGVVAAIAPQKAVIITYPADTPGSVIDQAMQAIKDAGGVITHEYKLIKYVPPILSS